MGRVSGSPVREGSWLTFVLYHGRRVSRLRPRVIAASWSVRGRGSHGRARCQIPLGFRARLAGANVARHPRRRMVPPRFAVLFSLGVLVACSGSAGSPEGSDAGATTSHTERYCPGARVAEDTVRGCPAPATIRPGRTCASEVICPSPNGLFGECRCVGGQDDAIWTCERAAPPAGYDPYPDCADEGVVADSACYLEGSRCIPVSASACFTKDVPLCTCEGHAWKC
jgi:hypothetical protein